MEKMDTLPVSSNVSQDDSSSQTVSPKSMRQKYGRTDVILECGVREFPAHRKLLAEVSPYFRSMFASEWKETMTGKVNMPTIAANTMQIIIDYLYSDKFPEPQDDDMWDLYLQVLEAVHLFEMTTLFLKCLQKLADNMSQRNFAKLLRVAELYDSVGVETKNAPRLSPTGLTARVNTFLAKNFLQYGKTQEFLQMDSKKLKSILLHPELEALTLEDITRMLLQWVAADLENRKDVLESLLLVLNPCFGKCVSELTHLWSTNKDIDTFNTHLQNMETKIQNCKFCRTSTVQRQKLLFYGGDRLAGHRVMKSYDLATEQWENNYHPPFPVLDGIEAISYSGHIFFFGMKGWMQVYTMAKVTHYCPCKNAVMSNGHLKHAVRFCGAVGLHGAIYVVGIRDTGKNKVNVVQRFWPTTGQCDVVAGLDDENKPLATFVLGNHVYVVSSSRDLIYLYVMRYEPLTDEWTMFTSIPKRFNSFTYTLFQDKFIFFKRDNMFVFDITSKQWEEIKHSGSPIKLEEIWPIWKDDKLIILARDKEFTLATFDMLSSQWLTKIRMGDFMQEEPFNSQYCGMLKCVPY